MASLTGFSFGGKPLKNISGSSSSPATPDSSQKALFGGSVLSKTPADTPPPFPGLFGQGGPVVTGSGAFGSGLSKTNTIGGTQPMPNSPANNLPVSFTFNSASLKLQGFGSTQPKAGSAIWSVSSTSNNTTAGQSATGHVPSTPALSSSNNTATSGTGNTFNAVFNTKNATSTGNLSGAPPATSSAFTFTAPQTTAGNNGPSIFATAGKVTTTAPPMTSIFGPSGQSAFPPVQAQPTSAAPSSSSIFAPAQTQSNVSVIGGQLAQLSSIAANRPATSLFGGSITPAAPEAATGNTTQPFFPPATSGHPGGPTVFSPPAVTSISSAAASAASAAPPVSSVPAPAQTQTSTPPTSILAPAASAPTSAASLGASLFGSTTTTSLSTSTATTVPHTSPAAKSLFAPVASAESDVSIGPEAKTSLPQEPPTSRLNRNRSLEEIVDRWSSDLETYKADFIQRGLEVKRLDAIIVESLSKTDGLNVEANEAERKGNTIDRMLDQLASDQEHLEKLLDYYEASLGDIEKKHLDYQPVDEERERVFQAVLTINDKLLELGTGLGDMIKELNDANAKVENTTNTENPLFPIVKILNNHLSVMQWVDAQTVSLAEKIKDVRMKSMVRPRDNEGDEAMRHYHNEYMNTFRM